MAFLSLGCRTIGVALEARSHLCSQTSLALLRPWGRTASYSPCLSGQRIHLAGGAGRPLLNTALQGKTSRSSCTITSGEVPPPATEEKKDKRRQNANAKDGNRGGGRTRGGEGSSAIEDIRAIRLAKVCDGGMTAQC
eukprot:jgi/Mesvir1/22866/Mv25882-RA.1